jgi:hypothetical protein
VTAKTTAARREKAREDSSLEHGGLFRKKPPRQRSITINPGKRSSREPMTVQQRAVFERRRRVEQHMEDVELAEVTCEVWDEIS